MGRIGKARVQEGVFAFPGKIPSPLKFNASTYKLLVGAIFNH